MFEKQRLEQLFKQHHKKVYKIVAEQLGIMKPNLRKEQCGTVTQALVPHFYR